MRNCGRGFTLLRRKADPRRAGFFVTGSLLIISDGESVPSGKIHPEAGAPWLPVVAKIDRR